MTRWFTKESGESGNNVYDVSEDLNPGGSAVLVANKPDWLKHPTTGEKIKIIDQRTEPVTCPKCGVSVITTVTFAEGGLCVIDCTACRQYIWLQLAKKPKEESSGDEG
jgi:hypothetical protein